MDNTNNNFQASNNGMPLGSPDGQEGTWVPVDASTLPFTVGGNPNQPIMGPDGSFYCIGQSAPSYGQIDANQYNAIPTPSQIVQLPPIVQPIALVPYASQNQPLVQYNPNYQPEIPLGNENDPVYRPKPYAGLNVLLLIFAILSIAAMYIFASLSAVSKMTGLDTVLGVVEKLGFGVFNSNYLEIINRFADNEGILIKIIVWAIPAIFTVLTVFGFVLIIKYLVRLGGKKSPRGFSVIAFIGLIFAVLNLVVFLMSDMILGYTIKPEIGIYVITGCYFLLFILPFFAKKGAMVIDLESSKRVFSHR